MDTALSAVVATQSRGRMIFDAEHAVLTWAPTSPGASHLHVSAPDLRDWLQIVLLAQDVAPGSLTSMQASVEAAVRLMLSSEDAGDDALEPLRRHLVRRLRTSRRLAVAPASQAAPRRREQPKRAVAVQSPDVARRAG